MTTNIQSEVTERLAKLLADSPLDEEIKKAILEGLDKLPDYLVFDLIDALENEKLELERIALDINLFLKQQSEEWQKLEEEQQAATDQLVEEELKKIENDLELTETRQKIAES